MTLVVACGMALTVGCAAGDETEPTKKSESDLVSFDSIAMEEPAVAEQGGCSNAQIRHCAQQLCRGTVDACYDTPDTAEYTCKCRNGQTWTGVDNLAH